MVDPVLPSYVDDLAKKLYTQSDFHYMTGMRVWHVNQEWVYLGVENWPEKDMLRHPDLCDFSTIGCIIQQAWRITEGDKQLAISAKLNSPTIITSNFIMSNISPPRSVDCFARAMSSFSLNGLTAVNGISNLIEVFLCNKEQQ